MPSETIETEIEEDEPAAPADETIAARLAEEAHRSWIQSITEQLGRMRRDEGVGGVTETPVVPAPHVQPEQAAMPKEQERTEPAGGMGGARTPRRGATMRKNARRQRHFLPSPWNANTRRTL